MALNTTKKQYLKKLAILIKDTINAEFDLDLEINYRLANIIIKHGNNKFSDMILKNGRLIFSKERNIIDCAFDEKQKILKVFTKINDYQINLTETENKYKNKIDELFENTLKNGENKIENLGLGIEPIELLIKVCKILKIDYFDLVLRGKHNKPQEIFFPEKGGYQEIKGLLIGTKYGKSGE